MTELLQYRRYALPFRVPMRTAHGPWRERLGVIVRRQDEDGNVGYGEAAPIPGFGAENVDEAIAVLASLGNRVEAERLAEIPAALSCLRQALAAATPVALDQAEAKKTSPGPDYLPMAALLPAGRAALEQVGPKSDAGFRTFKWKVGVGDPGDELALLDDLCGALPAGARLRLDANGAWDRRQAERWLERCADRPIEHVEQPVAPEARGAEDLLLGLAGDYPTPLALDESLVNQGDIERWLGAGWPGVYVVKPLLLAETAPTLAKLAAAQAKVVFSSALETGIGARSALRTAFHWAALMTEKEANKAVTREGAKESDGAATSRSPNATGKSRPQPVTAQPQAQAAVRALGFGVWPLFADRRFDGPAAAPFVYRDDVERIDPEAIWTALT
jgi:O-succinylbenzoate synthase